MLNPDARPTDATTLPAHPDLAYLKDQAKRLLNRFRKDDPDALDVVRRFHPKFRKAPAPALSIALHDAQWVIARQYGFGNWSLLKAEVESRARGRLLAQEQLLQAVRHGRLEDIRILLGEVLHTSVRGNALLSEALESIADRSVWHRPQFREIAGLLVDAGVECSIWSAARLGLLGHVQCCLHADPLLLESPDPMGRTPLQRAALIYGSDPQCEATMDWLVGAGAKVDVFTASAYSLIGPVQDALRRDPNIVHQKCQGSTPLNWAVRPRRSTGLRAAATAPDAEVCELLINHGADMESRDDQENGMRPLHHVGEWCGSQETAELLITRGADLHAKDDIGWTPLDYAVNRNRESMIACFRKHGALLTLVDWPNAWGDRRDAVFAAVKRNDVEHLKRLLTEDPSLATARTESGDTPLHWASHDGHYEAAALLLSAGADVFAQETRYWGGTPLHWAAERQPVLVELLLDHGADINSRNDRTGQTPLHYCARCDDVPEVAELLLARGADSALTDNSGNTPLAYALRSSHVAVAATFEKHASAEQ